MAKKILDGWYLGTVVETRQDIEKAMQVYRKRFGWDPQRAVVSERCAFDELLPALGDVEIERDSCMLAADLYLKVA